MNVEYSINHQERFTNNPYQDLHIYYLQGRLVLDYKLLGDCFIGNWEEDEFSFLFFSKQSDDKVNKIVNTQAQLTLIERYHMTYEQWQGGTVAPFKIGSFLITPPWESIEKEEEQLLIILDSGVVFGTGTHTTTIDCLEAIELVCSQEKVESVIDIGTGTGLLALAAARLGCKRNLAVDINFLSARTAQRNIRLNRLEERVLIAQGRAEDFMVFPADLLVANIHYDVMKHLISSQGLLNKKWFILSGLLRSQARDVANMLSRHPVTILRKWERDGIWSTFFGKIC